MMLVVVENVVVVVVVNFFEPENFTKTPFESECEVKNFLKQHRVKPDASS